MKTKSTATVADSVTLSQSQLLLPSPTDPWTTAAMGLPWSHLCNPQATCLGNAIPVQHPWEMWWLKGHQLTSPGCPAASRQMNQHGESWHKWQSQSGAVQPPATLHLPLFTQLLHTWGGLQISPSTQGRCRIQLLPQKIAIKLTLKFLASCICVKWIVKLTPLHVLFIWSQQINLPQI